MSKFRARQLDASKQIPIYLQEDVSDSTEFNNVTNRTVPQLPTGMEKEEETEHHLQQAIFHHRVIPVPEVYCTENDIGPVTYDQLYPPTYKASRQMIHIHPFSADQDIPDYDLDSEDEEWLQEQSTKGELLPLDSLQFEEMMDRLEKASGLKAVTLQEAKLLLKDDDDLITAVYDYWLNKRLRLEHPLIPQVKQYEVKSEKGVGSAPTDPYVAFRKRTEKMQTRKNRKNDETSYEKMLKLKRDLLRAVTLLEMVKRREKSKRELFHLNIELYEKRYEMEDFTGAIINEISSHRLQQQISRPAFAPITPNHKLGMSDFDSVGMETGSSNLWLKVPPVSRSIKEEGKRERRPYKKKRKYQQPQIPSSTSSASSTPLQQLPRPYIHPPDPYSIASIYPQTGISCAMASEDEVASPSEAEDDVSLDGYFAFRRKSSVNYHAPRETLDKAEDKAPPWGGTGDKVRQFYFTSVAHPSERVIGLARRRMGRGGRVWLDRIRHPFNDLKIKSELKDEGPNGLKSSAELVNEIKMDWPHYHPNLSTLADASEDSEDAEVDVETLSGVPPSPCIGEGVAHSSPHLEDTGGGGKDSTSLPSSYYITAEVLDGSHEGIFTDLQVTLPPLEDIDLLSVMDDSEEVDVLSTGGGSGKVSRSHSDTVVTCGGNSNSNNNNNNNNNNNVNAYSDSDTMDIDSNSNKSGIHSSTKWTLLTNCDGKNNSRNISVSNSPYNNNNNIHSTYNFQTQPTSKFLFSDITTTSHVIPHLSHHTAAGNRQQISTSSLVTGDENVKLLGIPQQLSSSSCSVSSSYSSLSSSFTTNSSSFSSTNALSSSSSHSSYVKNLSSDACTTSSSSSLSSVISSSSPKTLSVSSCLATSLSNNSLLCASPTNISSSLITKTNTKTNNDLQEQNASSKKLSNISSLYLRPQKEKFHLDSFPSGLLLTSSKTNGNDVITNSNSNLVSQKILSWTNENLNSEENTTSSLITNGPSTKSIDNLKCALFPET